jgi:hypothetical protein
VSIRQVEAAYRGARAQARRVSTVRLRLAERRGRQHAARLTQPELAALRALRDELVARGVEVPELWGPNRGIAT